MLAALQRAPPNALLQAATHGCRALVQRAGCKPACLHACIQACLQELGHVPYERDVVAGLGAAAGVAALGAAAAAAAAESVKLCAVLQGSNRPQGDTQ